MWWQSIAVWFAAAIIAHDLVLFPIYALADRLLLATGAGRQSASRVPVLNYVRVPVLGAGLTLLVFLPGIIEQGAPTFRAATGLTQDVFLGRWLLLTAAMFAISAVIYAIRLARVDRYAGVRLARTRWPIGWIAVSASPASSASPADAVDADRRPPEPGSDRSG